MKKFFYLAALLSLAACNKNGLGGPGEAPQGGECLLTTRFDAPATKVANQTLTNEKAVIDLWENSNYNAVLCNGQSLFTLIGAESLSTC